MKNFLKWLLKPFNDSLISEEGWRILADKNKRDELISIIEEHHNTGVWNYERLNKLTE